MGSGLLVESRIVDGQKLLAELVRSGFNVNVAFWAQTSEEGTWLLFIGSDAAEASHLAEAYRTVYKCLQQVKVRAIDAGAIKVVHSLNPIAQDVAALRDSFSDNRPTTFHVERIGNMAVEQIYVYPRMISTMTQDEVLHAVTGALTRRGGSHHVLVTLSDGSTLAATPTAIQSLHEGEIYISVRDAQTGMERQVPVADIVSVS